MRALLLSLATVLLLTTTAAANPEPEIDDRTVKGGNAMDRIAILTAALPREYWPLKYMAATLEGRILLYRYWLFRAMYRRPKPAPTSGDSPPPEPQLGPDDAPAESILDQMDENDAPPVLVGMPGTRQQSLDAMGEIPTPPAESILDQIEESPKPAANQATPPKLVEAPR